MSIVLSLEHVGVRYRRSSSLFSRASYYQALRDVSFDLKSGETFGILGQNGAGKSTLLRLMSGVIKPDAGRLLNFGTSVSLLALQAGFDHNLSGRDNAILTGLLHGYSLGEIKDQLEAINRFAGLGSFFEQPVRTYSSGMAARLGFAINMFTSPDVLLIDEVLSVGDEAFKAKAERAIIAKAQMNQTIVLVSHSRHQILRLCDRAIFIHDGVSSKPGAPADVLQQFDELLSSSADRSPA